MDLLQVNAYLEMVKHPKTSTRFDEVASFNAPQGFDEYIRQGSIRLYLMGAEYVKAAKQRAPKLALRTPVNSHLSGLFFPDPENLHRAFGDIQGTEDALLVEFSDDYSSFELFLFESAKAQLHLLFSLWGSGELDQAIEEARASARGPHLSIN